MNKLSQFIFKCKNLNTNPQGSVLVVVLFISVIFIILSGGLLSFIISEGWNTTRSFRSTDALNLAEAAIEEAIWEINYNGANFSEDDGWSGDEDKIKTSSLQTSEGITVGEYTVMVSDPNQSNIKIEVIGYVPSQASPAYQRNILVNINKEQESLFDMAAFGVNGVGLDTGVVTDSYDSDDGLYGGNNVGEKGDVGTNSISINPAAIAMGGTATINGDAFVGPSGDVNNAISGGTVSGNKSTLNQTYNPSSVEAPEGLSTSPDIKLGKNGSATITGNGQYGNITMGRNSTLTITADAVIYITNTLHFDRDSDLVIVNGANVTIYVDGSISFDQGSLINNVSKDPKKFGLYGTDNLTGTVQVDQGGDFFGTIYAPQADLQFDQGTIIYGAVVGKTVQLDRNCRIHFDESLLTAGGSSGGDYLVSTWIEK